MKPRAPEHIAAITPYPPGKPIEELERELGISGSIKLASNENPLGRLLRPSSHSVGDVQPDPLPERERFLFTKKHSEKYGFLRRHMLGNARTRS